MASRHQEVANRFGTPPGKLHGIGAELAVVGMAFDKKREWLQAGRLAATHVGGEILQQFYSARVERRLTRIKIHISRMRSDRRAWLT